MALIMDRNTNHDKRLTARFRRIILFNITENINRNKDSFLLPSSMRFEKFICRFKNEFNSNKF